MNLDARLENVSVIGAAGKMGSGIATLLAREMARLKNLSENRDKIFRLNLIDINEKAIDGLRSYLKSQLLKASEKSIVALRQLYQDRADLVENEEIIKTFLDDALGLINFGTDLALTKNSHLVFEAIVEDEETKIKVLKQINSLTTKNTLYLTNTSSIPISFLDEKVGLGGRIIGYHFYNPPVVQRLVEVIIPKTAVNELKEISTELGKRLGKTLVPANDRAGFIGNGHFMRDGLYALNLLNDLKREYGLAGAIYIMNRISQDFLIRPMGIFQLIDYVGIDVFQCILKVMSKHLNDKSLHNELIDQMVNKKIIGGQNPDGSQKDGFLKYEKNRPAGVYDIEKGEYLPLEELKKRIDPKIGDPPSGFAPWKKMIGDPKKDSALINYFTNLKNAQNPGAELARNYLKKTKEIALQLVRDGIANSDTDVNAVLTNGFYWIYGPINNYI
ncbi:MAG: 3-hydroxyacyl-CoA dehydrogenase family protein [candidate division WOR-3 bacterium]